jgi:hypothetical protein
MPATNPTYLRVYECEICGLKCKSLSGRTRHKRAQHLTVPVPEELKHYTRIYHEHLNGIVLCFEQHMYAYRVS